MKSREQAADKRYDIYVEHPRFGRRPRFTGLNPSPFDSKVRLHPNATTVREIQKRAELAGVKMDYLSQLATLMPKEPARIKGTAIKADPSKQDHPTVPHTHYFDVEKICRDCQSPFIFFAEEQKHWYEALHFPLDSDCVRCSACRKTVQFLDRNRSAYERLAGMKNREWKDNLKMAKSALVLVENGIFGHRVIQKIRRLLKTVPEFEKTDVGYEALLKRVKQAELKR
jgi:hypothetical protein